MSWAPPRVPPLRPSASVEAWAPVWARPPVRATRAPRRVPAAASGPDLKAALVNTDIFYCYIDDFYSGNTDDMKTGALFRELHRYLDSAVHLNANDMLDAALEATRISMTAVERKQFYDRHIKQMKLEIDENGDVSIELKR